MSTAGVSTTPGQISSELTQIRFFVDGRYRAPHSFWTPGGETESPLT